MKKFIQQLCVLTFLFAPGAAFGGDALSDEQIRKLVVQESIQAYPGNCPCPYNVDRAGRQCGGRSAWSKAGGYSPICYAKEVSDVQVRGEYGSPEYREYRGRQVPVYEPPSGFGLIDRVRGKEAWTVWVNLAPRLVTDMLILLGQQRQLYLGIDERKAGRSRWIRSISLQTTDPADE